MIYFLIILLFFPILFAFRFGKKFSIRDCEEYLRILKICKNVAEKGQIVVSDIDFVNNNIHLLSEKARLYSSLAGDEETLYRIAKILANDTLEKLTDNMEAMSDRCSFVTKKKNMREVINKLSCQTDDQITDWFIGENTLEYCKDLKFIKNFIRGEI